MHSVFDGSLISYANRDALGVRAQAEKADTSGLERASLILVVGGQVAGTWRRTLRARQLEVDVYPFLVLTPSEIDDIQRAAQSLQEYYGVSATTTIHT